MSCSLYVPIAGGARSAANGGDRHKKQPAAADKEYKVQARYEESQDENPAYSSQSCISSDQYSVLDRGASVLTNCTLNETSLDEAEYNVLIRQRPAQESVYDGVETRENEEVEYNTLGSVPTSAPIDEEYSALCRSRSPAQENSYVDSSLNTAGMSKQQRASVLMEELEGAAVRKPPSGASTKQ